MIQSFDKSPPRGGQGENQAFLNPGCAAEFPLSEARGDRPAKKHCAAQAEYGRLAAQAYSPSDAMSQARFCLEAAKKVQHRGCSIAPKPKRETAGLWRAYLVAEGGVIRRIFPAVGDLAA